MKTKILLITTMFALMAFSSLVNAYDINVSINVSPPPVPPLPISGMAIGVFKAGFFLFVMLMGFILLGLKLFLAEEKITTSSFLQKSFIFAVIGLLLVAAIKIILSL
jgi:hypothetical protein